MLYIAIDGPLPVHISRRPARLSAPNIMHRRFCLWLLAIAG